MILAGDFNINALDYKQNKKLQSFFNLMYRYNMILTINKPTRKGKNSASAIDDHIANCIIDCQFKTNILNRCKRPFFYCYGFENRRTYSSKPKGTKCTQTELR